MGNEEKQTVCIQNSFEKLCCEDEQKNNEVTNRRCRIKGKQFLFFFFFLYGRFQIPLIGEEERWSITEERNIWEDRREQDPERERKGKSLDGNRSMNSMRENRKVRSDASRSTDLQWKGKAISQGTVGGLTSEVKM